MMELVDCKWLTSTWDFPRREKLRERREKGGQRRRRRRQHPSDKKRRGE